MLCLRPSLLESDGGGHYIMTEVVSVINTSLLQRKKKRRGQGGRKEDCSLQIDACAQMFSLRESQSAERSFWQWWGEHVAV